MKKHGCDTRQLSFDFLSDAEPIPDCDYFLQMVNKKGKRFRKKEDLAREYIHQLKIWRTQNPNKDILSIVPPNWINYTKENI